MSNKIPNLEQFADADMLARSIKAVTRWVEEHDFRAYDPGDGSMSFLRHLTLDVPILKRILTAAVLRTPFHIRPLLGIAPHTSTKGVGYMGWGYIKMFALTGEERYRRQAEFCFDWLVENRSRDYQQYCWGNHFSFSTRAGTIPAHTPTIVWSSLIGQAFLEAHAMLGNGKYLEVAASTAEWVKSLPREKTSRGTCLSYVPFKQSSIHNSNLLGASLLARVARYTQDAQAIEIARNAVTYSCERQNDDGSWFYGEESRYHWIDNFHTGYNLDCLKRYIDDSGDRTYESAIRSGYEYFKRIFFEMDGKPKYYHNNSNPIDIQCGAQAIDTLTFFSDHDPDALELAIKVARWTIENMQAADGHFYYRDLGWKKVKTPMLHWGQGTMFKAMANLLNKMSGSAARVKTPETSYEVSTAGIPAALA
jgi:rhamnogalacturonyl hydrolase YesR